MLNYYSSHLKMKNPLKSPTFWNYTLNRVLRTLPVIMAVLLLTLGFPTGHGPVYDIGRSNITGNCINKGWYEFTFSTASLVEFPYVVSSTLNYNLEHFKYHAISSASHTLGTLA